MNTDTHFNPGGGGAAYAIRTAPSEIQAGDRVRTYDKDGKPVYGTVNGVYDTGYSVRLDTGRLRLLLQDAVTFHGRPHAAFNKGGAQ